MNIMKKESINRSLMAAIPCISMESLLFSYKNVLMNSSDKITVFSSNTGIFVSMSIDKEIVLNFCSVVPPSKAISFSWSYDVGTLYDA